LGVSLLVHCLFMVALYRTQLLSSDLKIPDNTVYVDLDKMPPPPSALAQEKDRKRQIVETETSADQVKPKDADYLGEHDQAVDKQTKARQVDIFRKGGVQSKAGSGGKPQIALKDLAPPSSKPVSPPTQAEIDGMRAQEKQQLARQEHNAGGQESADNPGSASNDFLENVKEGDRTLLNTKEFVYFSYYRRIREKLEVAWNSKLRSTMDTYMYGGRHLANDRNYITGVVVVLDRNGKITAVKVLQNSGARDLDDAAVGAFNEAGPFPDPPAGLVDKNGQIQIRWDFILQS
ncbi:MAG: energy transducer TonB family protein, partial [Bdellovibrionota bacterium]